MDKEDLRKRTVRNRKIKESVQRHSQLSGRSAQKATKTAHKAAKRQVANAKADYQALKGKAKAGQDVTASLADAKESLSQAKAAQKTTRKIHKAVKKSNPTIPQKARSLAKQTAKRSVGEIAETAFSQDDTLSSVARARQKARELRYTGRLARKTGAKGAKVTYKLARSSLEKDIKMSKYVYKGARRGLKTTKDTAKTAQKALTTKVRTKWLQASTESLRLATSRAVAALASVLANPITWIVATVVGFLFFIVIIVSSIFSSNIVQQTEFTLNQSWLYLSQKDREKSNDKVAYYTNIDDILLYMNYRYGGEWEPDAPWDDGLTGKIGSFLGFSHFSDALNDIWETENGDITQLKTMAELYSSSKGKAWMWLSKDELAEYKDILDAQKENGRYAATQELTNPFYAKDDDKGDSATLTITKRYGFTSQNKVDTTTTLEASAGQTLYAPMDGKVTITKKDLQGKKTKTTNLIIKASDAHFIFYNVKSPRVKTGDKVETSQELAQVKRSGQKIAYAKRYGKTELSSYGISESDLALVKNYRYKKNTIGFLTGKGKNGYLWTLVNPGFYFPFVTYSQTTTVTTTSSEMSGRAKQFYDYIKKYYPSTKDNGIAAAAGCFGVESSINPKRAEGDYLSPPVGASEGSWDDDAWLSLGGPAIYGGGYANILHRGLGLGQWTDTADGATRHTLLRNFAKSKDKKWYDLELQVQFMLEGDNPYYINILKRILDSSGDVDSLTAEFLSKWEGVPGNKLAERQKIARQALLWFHQPTLAGGGSLASSWNFPEAYRSKVKSMPTAKAMTTQPGSGYPVGQCTWYAYNRLVELGEITDLSGSYARLGNGGQWVSSLVAKGWKFSSTPKEGAVVSTAGGFDGTFALYGHVGIVEAVNDDGTFLVSECNFDGVQDKIHWRVYRPASYYTFATPN